MPRKKKRSTSSSSKQQKQKAEPEKPSARRKSLENETQSTKTEEEKPVQQKKSSSSSEKQKERKGKPESSNNGKQNVQNNTENSKAEVEISHDWEEHVPISESGGTEAEASNEIEKHQFGGNMSNYDQAKLSELIENHRKKAKDKTESNYNRYVQQLLKMANSDSHQLAVYLTLPEKGFKECLNVGSMDFIISFLWLIIISKACQSSFHGCNKYITKLVLSSEFWIVAVPSILHGITHEEEKYMFIDLLVSAATSMSRHNFNESIVSYVKSVPLNSEAKQYLTSKLDNMKMKICSWNEVDNCSEIYNNRCNENIIPSARDLDGTFPPFLSENIIVGSYGTIDDYLDTQFYLVRENVISQYRTPITMYRNKTDDKPSTIHTNVVVVEKFFDIDGIHVTLLFPPNNHQVKNKLDESTDLCISSNDFTSMEFATVVSLQPGEHEEFLVHAKLLDCDLNSIVAGSEYVVVESGKFSSIHRQVLNALKEQKFVSFSHGIVYVKKSVNTPTYINKSTVIDLTPVIPPHDTFAGTKEKYPSDKKIKVLSSWSKSSELSISPAHAIALEEVLQRELALVKGNTEMGKSFAINLLKLFDFNKTVWKEEKKSLIVICESTEMFEGLNAEIKRFSNNFVALCKDAELQSKGHNAFEIAIKSCGKCIECILQEIEFCESHPLLALESVIIQHGYSDLIKPDFLKDWLGLTVDMNAIFSKEKGDLYNLYKKIKNNHWQNEQTTESFNKFTCIMLKEYNETNNLVAKNVTDVWSLNLSNRWKLASYWMNSHITALNKRLHIDKQNYRDNMEILDDLSCNVEWRKLSKANIICVTIRDAIKRMKVIEKLNVPIIIIVEADRIPEPYLIPFLASTSLEHLILIGDAEQSSFVQEKYSFSISMYNRLLLNDIPVSDLMNESKLEQTEKPECLEDVTYTTLPCGHTVSSPLDENLSYTCQQDTYITLDCGHHITLPCAEKDKQIICEEIIKTVLPCNHSVNYKCCERDNLDITCTGTVKVPLPCSHTVEIRCVELIEKREKYYSCGCYETCNATLECGHPCVGKCSNCTSLAVHKGCDKKCDIQLACGHICQGLCNVPCPPCSLPCEWECLHGKCNAICGKPCDPCTKQCTRICEHRTCDKMCWEKCDKELCEEPCQLLLKCGHNCNGICGEPCPSLCLTCSVDQYKELCSSECSRILELDCGHMVNLKSFTLTLKQMAEQNERPVCSHCKNLLKNQGYVGSFVQEWFRANHERKVLVKNLVQAALQAFRFSPIVIKGQVDHSNIEALLDTMDNNNDLSSFILGKINILYIIILVRIENTVKSLKEFSPVHELLVKRSKNLCQWLRMSWKNTSYEQLESCSWEVYKLHQLCEICVKQQNVQKYQEGKKTLSFIRLERMAKLLEKTKRYDEQVEKKVKTELTKVSKENPELGNLFVKRIHPVTKQKYDRWLKGNVTREQLNWKFEGTEDTT